MGTEGSRGNARQPDRPGQRAPERAPRAETEPEIEPGSIQLTHGDRKGMGALREAITRSTGDTRVGLVRSLQRSYGNAAVGRLLQRHGGTGVEPATSEVPAGQGDEPASASPSDRPMLRLGSSGAVVNQLQSLLNTLGASPPLAVDGQFGSASHGAVVAFQRSHSLAADGIVGPQTWGALYGAQPTFAEETTPGGGLPEGAVVGSETPEEESDALYEQAHALYDASQYAQALVPLRRIYSLPELPAWQRAGACGNMGLCYYHLGRREEAISAFEEYLTFPEPKVDEKRMMILDAIRELRTGEANPTERNPSAPAPTPAEQAAADAQALVEINAAHACGHSEDYQGALTHAQTAYALRNASPHFRLAATTYVGLACQRLEQFDTALDMFQEALGFPEGAFNQPVGDANPVTRDEILTSMRNARTGTAETPANQQPMPVEEQDALMDQSHELFHQGQYAACLKTLERVYPVTEDYRRRATCVLNMGRCHQRMGDFDRAVSLFMEAAQYPPTDEDYARTVQELLRQARMREQGTHITAGQPEEGATPGDLQHLFRGEVYFETGANAVTSLGETTMRQFADLLNQRKSAEPQLDIFVTVIGHSSSRWATAANEQQRHELNEELSVQRANTVATSLRGQLLPTTTGSFIVDGTGDGEGDRLGTGPQDNSWFFRGVTIIAEGGAPPAQG